MPIYAYRCSSCGYQQDVLQKISAEPLTVCPSCGKPDFHKQLSAPAFQLKGTGWYVTDFRDNGTKPAGQDAKQGHGRSESSGEAGKSTSSGAAEGASAAGSTASSGAASGSASAASGSD